MTEGGKLVGERDIHRAVQHLEWEVMNMGLSLLSVCKAISGTFMNFSVKSLPHPSNNFDKNKWDNTKLCAINYKVL